MVSLVKGAYQEHLNGSCGVIREVLSADRVTFHRSPPQAGGFHRKEIDEMVISSILSV